VNIQASNHSISSSLEQDTMLSFLCKNETPVIIYSNCTFGTSIVKNKVVKFRAIIVKHDYETILVANLNARTFERIIYKNDIAFLKPITPELGN
jgi:hypothetical protein